MSRKKSNKALRSSLISLTAIVITGFAYLISSSYAPDSKPVDIQSGSDNGKTMIVRFLDVGQGDSEFIEFPNGECMLIDAGNANNGDDIADEIKNLGYSTVDYLVATHPHTDHIGGMEEVVDELNIGSIYMPRASSNSRTFEELLEEISEKGLRINTARSGKLIFDKDGIKAEFLSPIAESYDDLNNYSCVIKITYGSSSFIFTGDAESVVEKELLKSPSAALDCDVLKVGHHGSRYSSTKDFLNALTPEIAVISCGAGNSYNHPHKQALDRLEKSGAEIYRTDLLGEIVITTSGDGKYEVDYR